MTSAAPTLSAWPGLARRCALSLGLLPLLAQGLAVCSTSSTGVAFGNYTVSNPAPADVTGNVQVTCTLIGTTSVPVAYDILLSSGASGSYAARQAGIGPGHLQYNLYTGATHSAIWGDGTGGSVKVSDAYQLGQTTVVRNYAVYGRAPATQNIPVGIYTDSITVTLNY